MKKSLSLLAIVGLLLSIGLVSHVSANAPVFPDLPDLKLYIATQSLSPAFDLAKFNNAPDAFGGDKATGYSIVANFASLSNLSSSAFSGLSSNVNQGAYGAATSATNSFLATNAGGSSSTTASKAKYSTYKLNKLPKVGLTLGSSWSIPLAGYCFNSTGAALAPSIANANPNAIIISDATKVTATLANSTITISLISTASSPITVDVIASPVGTGAIGADQDKERIWVYQNLLNNGTFATAADTAAYGLEVPPGKTTMGTGSWQASVSDSNSLAATGVYQFNFVDATGGIKMTPFAANYVAMSANQWYTARVRLMANTGVLNSQFLLFNENQALAAGVGGDISADAFIALSAGGNIPTAWTWLETPLFVHTAASGFPQIQIKAGGAMTVNIDEIQVVNAPPTLYDASENNARQATRAFYTGGLFSISSATSLWGTQTYTNTASQPAFNYTSDTVIGSALAFNYTGASGSSMIGNKWTASSNPGVSVQAYTAPAANHQVGARISITAGGGFNTGTSLDIVLIEALGVDGPTLAANIISIDAAAEVGKLVDGNIRTAGNNIAPYYQLQFGSRAMESGTINVANIDFDSDVDDPNYGTAILFP